MTIFAKAGHRVVAVYLTKGEAGIMGKSHKESADIRVKEAEAACEIMGIDCMFLTQIDGSTEINSQRYKEVYDALIGEKPDILFTHWPIDTHRDHRICSVLVYDAWLRMNEKPQLYYYEVMTGKQSQNFYPTDYCDITSVIDIKHKACFVHASQNIEAEYHLDHGKMEEFRGLEYGCRFAEAFIRHVQSPDGRLK